MPQGPPLLIPRLNSVLLLIAASLLIFSAVSEAADGGTPNTPIGTIHGEYSLLGAIHRTGGSGDRTLLRRGEFLTNELTLNYEQPLPAEWMATADVHVRNTNDEQLDPYDGAHVLGWTTELYNPYLRFTGGNFYADYSQYTLQQSLTGVQAALTTERVTAKTAFGYSLRDIEGQRYRRYAGGGRTELLLAPRVGPASDVRMGLNFSGSEDARDTIDNTAGVSDASNRVGSVNAHVLLWNMSDFSAELARSWNKDDTTPGNVLERANGTALRVNNITKFSKRDKLRLNYEWVSSHFNTLSGSAVPDRVNLSSRFDHRWNSRWSANVGYRVMVDKLEKSDLLKRTVTQAPRAEISWEPGSDRWYLKNFTSRVYAQARNRVSSEFASGQTDFHTNELGLENEFQVRKARVSTGWSISAEDDDRDKTNDRLTNVVYAAVRTRTKWFGVAATPSLRYQMEYSDLSTLEGRDLTHTVSEGLRLDISEALFFEQRCSVSTASRLAHDSDSIRVNAYLGLDYHLPVQQDLTFRTSYEHISFVHDVSIQRFSEDNFQTQLLLKF